MKIPTTRVLSVPLLSDGFSAAASDGLGHQEVSGVGAGGENKTWTGATWTVAAGAVTNAPTAGAELVTNGDMESGFTAGLANGWSTGGGTHSEDTVAPHGGSSAQQTDVTAANQGILQALTTVTGAWYQVAAWLKSDGSNQQQFFVRNTSGGAVLYLQIISSATWTQAICTVRAISTSTYLYLRANNTATFTIYADDATFKPLTLSTLFRTASLSTSDVYASVKVTRTAGTQAGLVLCLDSAATPANFVICYLDGAGNVVVEKCVAGTYSTLSTNAVTYSAGAALVMRKIGTEFRCFYNGLLVSTNTIADAGIVDNLRCGLFSCYQANSFDDFVVFASGTGEEYNILDNF